MKKLLIPILVIAALHVFLVFCLPFVTGDAFRDGRPPVFVFLMGLPHGDHLLDVYNALESPFPFSDYPPTILGSLALCVLKGIVLGMMLWIPAFLLTNLIKKRLSQLKTAEQSPGSDSSKAAEGPTGTPQE